MTAPIEWITTVELVDAIPPRIGALTEQEAADWIAQALDDIIDVATLPAAPTDAQAEAVRRAIIAYTRWGLEGKADHAAGLEIGHVKIPATSASRAGVTPLPAKVWTILRNAGLLTIPQAVAY